MISASRVGYALRPLLLSAIGVALDNSGLEVVIEDNQLSVLT